MTTNRLAKAAEPKFDRSKWTLKEHCDHANAQLILNDTNEKRRKDGLPPVKWIIRNKRLEITFA